MARINQTEADKAIHSTKENRKNKPVESYHDPTPEKDIIFYSFLGDHDYLEQNEFPAVYEEDSRVLAKKTIGPRIDTYEIKFDHHNQMFNPIGLYTNKSDKIFLRKRDIERQRFVKVDKDVFENYVKFLSTKNALWLARATRLL